MTEATVLDASALLAFVRREPGADRVAAAIGTAVVSAVNYAEAASKLLDLGDALEAVTFHLGRLQLELVPFDTEAGLLSASLRPATKARGLSLGDRACLALGLARRLPVLTADREWLSLDLGVEVRAIR
jgi:PIN domain nuclease of toxin-antitoxin system